MKLSAFRDQLVERLCSTRYAVMRIADDQLDEVARKIGVHPDVLIEARVRHRLGEKKLGLRHGTEKGKLDLHLPEVIWNAWQEEVELRGVQSATLLRSVVHAYLLSSYEPPEALMSWRWKGRVIEVSHRRWEMKHKKGWPWKITVKMPPGAARSLMLRGKARGIGATAIVRALLLEILDGRWRDVRLVEAKAMADDERSYHLGGAKALLDGV